MSTHTQHIETSEAYFCTITCHRWLPLFKEADAYIEVYNWFEHLKSDGCHLLGYVIMPNHIHCILFPTVGNKSLNRLVSEGKRFMAYGVVRRLKEGNRRELLKLLAKGVQDNEREKGKRHQVFRLSFDAKACKEVGMLEQKLNYIHNNPVSGKWNLADDFTDYQHSSAGFYENGTENEFITHYKEVLNEIEL